MVYWHPCGYLPRDFASIWFTYHAEPHCRVDWDSCAQLFTFFSAIKMLFFVTCKKTVTQVVNPVCVFLGRVFLVPFQIFLATVLLPFKIVAFVLRAFGIFLFAAILLPFQLVEYLFRCIVSLLGFIAFSAWKMLIFFWSVYLSFQQGIFAPPFQLFKWLVRCVLGCYMFMRQKPCKSSEKGTAGRQKGCVKNAGKIAVR